MWAMSLGKSLEELTSTELDDLLKLMGVRQHILMRGHVDGYRLVRLTNAQLTGFPFTAMERWKLQMIRTAHTVFKVFTRGSSTGGSCPIDVICAMLKSPFGYDDDVIEEVRQGLLSHTVAMRNAANQRVVTFDQWAQLFDWLGSRLDLHEASKLQARMGLHMRAAERDQCRDPLQVMNPSKAATPCMPLPCQETSFNPTFSLMAELFNEVVSGSPTASPHESPLQEEVAANPGSVRAPLDGGAAAQPRAPVWSDAGVHLFTGALQPERWLSSTGLRGGFGAPRSSSGAAAPRGSGPPGLTGAGFPQHAAAYMHGRVLPLPDLDHGLLRRPGALAGTGAAHRSQLRGRRGVYADPDPDGAFRLRFTSPSPPREQGDRLARSRSRTIHASERSNGTAAVLPHTAWLRQPEVEHTWIPVPLPPRQASHRLLRPQGPLVATSTLRIRSRSLGVVDTRPAALGSQPPLLARDAAHG